MISAVELILAAWLILFLIGTAAAVTLVVIAEMALHFDGRK